MYGCFTSIRAGLLGATGLGPGGCRIGVGRANRLAP